MRDLALPRETGSKTRGILTSLGWGFWPSASAPELARARTIGKEPGKGLLKNATGAAADCAPSTLEQLSDKEAAETGDRNQLFVIHDLQGGMFPAINRWRNAITSIARFGPSVMARLDLKLLCISG